MESCIKPAVRQDRPKYLSTGSSPAPSTSCAQGQSRQTYEYEYEYEYGRYVCMARRSSATSCKPQSKRCRRSLGADTSALALGSRVYSTRGADQRGQAELHHVYAV